ncbi:formin-binding protein 4 isoform X2 [Agrilus planipennis]|uniref:Formin-binding protein 4 isoform X2 n=1 Tax=Agrilus planipennis TaxID=224129 RepID=A0A1W4XGD6_AGRPL|nr:formin-binding protein 4 isoform X2 [Agrilus planipennis]
MDSTLNDFFDEINKITPAKKKQIKTECVWQECFDESSGYVYYWNTTTDEVTWEMPETYRLWKDKTSKTSLNLYMPPQASSFLSNAKVQNNLKIYKISECKGLSVRRKEETLNENNDLDYRKKVVEGENIKSAVESKKVMLVPSYELESESEENHSSCSKSPDCEEGINTEDNKLEECDSDKCEIDVSTEQSKSCNISKQLNDKIYEKPEDNQNTHCVDVQMKTVAGGFSLVAGYGNSDEDDEVGETTTPKDANLTDFKQFIEKERKDQQKFQMNTESILHQRKKRINLEYTTTKKNTPILTGNNEYAGLGYNDSNKNFCCIKKKYMGFKSGGILFVSSDISADSNLEKGGENISINEEENKCKWKMLQDIEETSQALSEKLRFLSEGREPTSAVQTLFIQMETLNAALKANSLTPKYLADWLQDTCSELVKLEQSAAPAGWSLQWDRPNKRYFYYNRKTGENQWEYPQPNVIRSDEAMDICTTPPLEETFDEQSLLPPSILPVTVPVVPPPPPSISKVSSPSPPPPPYIGQYDKANNEITGDNEWSRSVAEPLPPGVDVSEISKSTDSTNNQSKTSDVLGQELNFFYSDIAALEGQVNTPKLSSQSGGLSEKSESEEVPKRKKRKVKIADGLSLKKKGVSKLVEKWKNVQKDLNYSNQ